MARTSDEQIIENLTACKLAATTRGHDFLVANDSEDFLRAARALTLLFPPVVRVADVTDPIADLPYMPPEKLEKWRAERDAAREASKKET